MEYVKGVDNRSQKKKEKAEKENKVKKEAINKYRAAEQRTTKMTKNVNNYPLDSFGIITHLTTRLTFTGHVTEDAAVDFDVDIFVGQISVDTTHLANI